MLESTVRSSARTENRDAYRARIATMGRALSTPKFKGGFETKRKADDARNQVLLELRNGLPVKPAPTLLGDFLDEWLDQHAARKCSPKTRERYGQFLAYLHPDLKRVRLADVSTLMLEREYNRLLDSGGRDRKKKKPRPLSARTVRHIADTVRGAMNTAMRWKLLCVNQATACVLPPIERHEARALDATQLEWYLAAARGHWMYPVLVFASATGCRRGEVLAVTWPDVDRNPGAVTISKSLEQTKSGLRIKAPKNGRMRELDLPAIACEMLEAHRTEQRRNRSMYGADYRTDLNLVFAAPDGNYLKPDTVTSKACVIARKAGLESIGIHSLRHSHGSQLLSNGVPLATVSKRLGHSSVSITAQIYAHAFRSDDIAAAKVWDVAMRKMIEGQQARQ